MADPIWVILGSDLKEMPVVMAKKELFRSGCFKKFFQWLGAIPVDRSGADVNALKQGLKTLKNGKKLIIFPEGTRVKEGEKVTPKGGAILFSVRTQTPVVPVYLSRRKKPFCPICCVFGTPYLPECSGGKGSEDEYQRLSEELMCRIFKLGGSC